jgi:two-component system response regulator AtoC
VQIRLLRVLQEQEFERVGGTETIRVDVRVIAATHRDLETAIQDGSFREDLYYRLNVIPVFVPPLRERKEDIPLLVEHFLTLCAETSGKRFEEIDPRALELLMQYDWPGNVRELENVIKRAAIIAKDHDVLLPKHLSFVSSGRTGGGLEAMAQPADSMTLSEKLEQVERAEIINALKKANWVQTHAAEILGINRSGLRYKMKQLNIVPLQE